MKINPLGSPLDVNGEPVKSVDSSNPPAVDQGRGSGPFSAHLGAAEQPGRAPVDQSAGPVGLPTRPPDNPTRLALEEIANATNLSNAEESFEAARKSAELLVRSALGEKYRDTEQARQMFEALGEQVAADPFLKAKLLAILMKIKAG